MASILTTIKKLLGIEEEYTHFDTDIMMYINSEFLTLSQIGIGPTEGYLIVDGTETWDDYLGEGSNFEAVASYIYLKVRLIFDPPANSFTIEAINKRIQELEWRLNIKAEEVVE